MRKHIRHPLVNNRVFDKAAKLINNIGPNIGWKLAAVKKLSDEFPNQIWVRSQAIDLSVQVSLGSSFPEGISQRWAICTYATQKPSPSVQRVNKSPEKQIAAIPMKNTNWDTIARRDLQWCVKNQRIMIKAPSSQNDDIVWDGKECQSVVLR